MQNYPIHPVLPAADIPRAKAWYSDKLGLSPSTAFPDLLIYGSDPIAFTIYETPSVGTARNTAAAWNVTDLASVMGDLRSRGVVFEEYEMGDLVTVDGVFTDDQGGLAAWFKDSEGNTLVITQLPKS